jgi:hydroxymethylglutaryl-CoA lyase
MTATPLKLVECPRDAMQGWKHFIPTEKKIEYIQSLLAVGFDTLDFGSFVSPKAIPQMADTPAVLKGLDLSNSSTKLLAIVANQRGAEDASAYDEIKYLGFPFSISETFQQRNTNSSIITSLGTVENIRELCDKTGKQLVVYISMGFGNPYGDPYTEDIVSKWVSTLIAMDISILSLADTVGLASAEQVGRVVRSASQLTKSFPDIELGVHLHSTALNWESKLDAAVKEGCRRFDGALRGVGGCPMANDELVGNMDSVLMLNYFKQHELLRDVNINYEALQASLQIADEIFR